MQHYTNKAMAYAADAEALRELATMLREAETHSADDKRLFLLTLPSAD